MLEKTYGLRAELMYLRLFILWNCLEREQRTHYQAHKPASQTDEARGIQRCPKPSRFVPSCWSKGIWSPAALVNRNQPALCLFQVPKDTSGVRGISPQQVLTLDQTLLQRKQLICFEKPQWEEMRTGRPVCSPIASLPCGQGSLCYRPQASSAWSWHYQDYTRAVAKIRSQSFRASSGLLCGSGRHFLVYNDWTTC